MKERIFTLTAKSEIPERFLGATIPFTVPTTLDEIRTATNNDEATLVAVFNQAHALNIQKHVKAEANKDGATVDTLRAAASGFKYGQVRERKGNAAGGATKVRPQTVEKALGQDFLASLTPEQRALYDKQMASLRPKVEEVATSATTSAAPSPSAGGKGEIKPSNKR